MEYLIGMLNSTLLLIFWPRSLHFAEQVQVRERKTVIAIRPIAKRKRPVIRTMVPPMPEITSSLVILLIPA